MYYIMNKYVYLGYMLRDTFPIMGSLPSSPNMLPKLSLIKHICSWRDKLIVLWTLNRQAKRFSRISKCLFTNIWCFIIKAIWFFYTYLLTASSGEPVCRNNVCVSNSVSAINFHPTKSVKTRNMCSDKPVCRDNVRSSKPICRNNVCQNKPTYVNILPCKPVLTDHTYQVDLSELSQQLFFIIFLSILIFSVYHKFSIITMNIFTNLLLAIVILLSKLTCFR